MRAMRLGNGGVRGMGPNDLEDDEVMRWAGTLPRARVTRWGGMISTPDAVLQVRLKEKLNRISLKKYFRQ